MGVAAGREVVTPRGERGMPVGTSPVAVDGRVVQRCRSTAGQVERGPIDLCGPVAVSEGSMVDEDADLRRDAFRTITTVADRLGRTVPDVVHRLVEQQRRRQEGR